MFRRLHYLAILPALLISLLCYSQDVPNPGMKTVELHVRVYLDNDHDAPPRFRVSLLSDTGSTIFENFTDDSGEAIFVVVGRHYQLRVTGPGIEETTGEKFEVNPDATVQFETVRVRRVDADKPVDLGNATISSAQSKVPAKATEQFDKGTAALKSGDMEEARTRFQQALKIYPSHAGAWNNLGIIAIRSGDAEGAQTYFKKAVDADPGFAPPMVNLSKLLLRRRGFKEAETLLQRASSLEPRNAEVLVLLAETELINGNFDLAIANARRVPQVSASGSYSIAHVIAGTALQQKKQPQEAIAEYRQFLAETPHHPAAGRIRATIRALGGAKNP